MGVVHFHLFWVTKRTASATRKGLTKVLGGVNGLSIPCEPGVAEHFQPVGMHLAGQEFGRALPDSFWPPAAQESSMVEKELQQG